MKDRTFLIAALILGMWLSASVPALAQGIVIPEPPPDQPMPPVLSGPITVVLHRVTVEINDQVATTHVEQIFRNDADFTIEGSYIFPLPEEAAISDFAMWVDGQKFEGKLLRREEARAIYESIVRRRRDPALLEYIGRDLFQASVFPIPPHAKRRIELRYSQVLPKENSLVHFVYPLRTDRFTQRPVETVAISVRIQSSVPIKAIYSPSHDVVVEHEGEYKARVGYEESNVLPKQDFELYFSVDDADIGLSLLSYKPAGEDGFFLLLAAPKVEVDASQVVAKDVLFVLDTSGSMKGEKLEQAKAALHYVLDNLQPRDRFNVISFSTGVRQFARKLQPASAQGEAKAYVDRLRAGGGTDINRALLEALYQVDPERPTILIFLTDGLPTEGETNPDRIIANVERETPDNVRLFAFGVGDDVNTVLLDRLAQEQRGTSAYVRPGQSIDEVVSGFYAKVSTPVLADIRLDFGDVLVEDMYPYPLPDLFAGTQLVVTGRYRRGGPVTVKLTGQVNGEPRAFVYEDQMLRKEGGEPFIARLWATRKIGYLLNQIRLQGGDRELIDEVVELSLRYGIVTPYTSYLVQEPQVVQPPVRSVVPTRAPLLPLPGLSQAQPSAPRVVETVVVEKAKIVEKEVEKLAAAPAAAAEGAAAVDEAEAREALRSAQRVEEVGSVRHVGDKAFVLRGGVWVDTLFDSATMQVKEIEFGSDAYFDLVATHPDWGPYFALGTDVIVVLDGQAYRVRGAAGAESTVVQGGGEQPGIATALTPVPPSGGQSQPVGTVCPTAIILPAAVGIIALRLRRRL